MTNHPTILEQLAGTPEIADGVWDICAHCRDIGEVSREGLFFYPSMRYPTFISWNAMVRKSDGREMWFGGMFKRWAEDSTIVCLRFQIGRLNIDLFWDNNISIVPLGGKVS